MVRKFDIDQDQARKIIPTTDNLQKRLSARQWFQRNLHYFEYELEERINPDLDKEWNYSRRIWNEDSDWKEKQTEVSTWFMEKGFAVESYREENNWHIKISFEGILYKDVWGMYTKCKVCSAAYSEMPFEHFRLCEYYKDEVVETIHSWVPCTRCDSRGYLRQRTPNSGGALFKRNCPECLGQKEKRMKTILLQCYTCNGKGSYYKVNPLDSDYELEDCLACQGSGKIEQREPVETGVVMEAASISFDEPEQNCTNCNDTGIVLNAVGGAVWCPTCSAPEPMRFNDPFLVECIDCEGEGIRRDYEEDTLSECSTCSGVGRIHRDVRFGLAYGMSAQRLEEMRGLESNSGSQEVSDICFSCGNHRCRIDCSMYYEGDPSPEQLAMLWVHEKEQEIVTNILTAQRDLRLRIEYELRDIDHIDYSTLINRLILFINTYFGGQVRLGAIHPIGSKNILFKWD